MVKHIAASLGMVVLAGSMAFAAQSTAPTPAPKSVTQSPSGQSTSATKATTKKHHKHHKKSAAAQKSAQTPQTPSTSK